ncbi:hypothetical protein AJ78_06032 [Emergomyces pasteurianus Ep9510]|uniref:Uncharacterized protein n=1 Tax=Emergomyces pasteurianus Ep9510 TaxID=1447872 RepID=A0A1J9QC83_9EURO|nr:hypothetical protein AJ78_06032 [Emergomyces pasteurianus Ep9510]
MPPNPLCGQLSTLAEKASLIAGKFESDHDFTSDQYEILETLTSKISEAIARTTVLIQSKREAHFAEHNRFLSQMLSERDDLIESGQLPNETIFRRNIELIFHGPKLSNLDSRQTKGRKEITRHRCDELFNLSSDGIIFWATTLQPVNWAGGSMTQDHFKFLIVNVDLDRAQMWPSQIFKILRVLATEAPLHESRKYETFLKALKKSSTELRSSKRRHVTATAEPSSENLQPQSTYTSSSLKRMSALTTLQPSLQLT